LDERREAETTINMAHNQCSGSHGLDGLTIPDFSRATIRVMTHDSIPGGVKEKRQDLPLKEFRR
jgi:hypothetical protein